MIRIVLLSLLTACSGLDEIGPSCGNGVVETGEDCDGGSGCNQCSITCSDGVCPAAYACGADRLCHAPGGRFRAVSTQVSFPELGFGITDIDRDHAGDVLALGSTSLTVYSGSPTSPLASSATAITPSVDGQPAVSDLDSDGVLDLVIPTVDGLLAYTSPTRVPAPYSFPVDVAGNGTTDPGQLFAFSLGGSYLAVLVDDRHHHLAIAFIDGTIKNNLGMPLTSVSTVCAGIDPAIVDPRQHDTYTTPASHLLAVTTGAGTCEIEVAGSDGTFVTSSHVVTSPAPAAMSRTIFARLEPTACPSLIITGSGISEAMATGAAGSCSTGATRALFGFPGSPIGHVRLDDTHDAIATESGIWSFAPAGTPISPPLYAAVRPIAAVALGDINGDGETDVVSSAGTFDDLDVLVRYGSGTTGGFLPRSIDTANIPDNLTTGDFDGDGVDDITYTERLTDANDITTERMMVAFGGHDSITSPKFVAAFTNVVEAVTMNLKSASDPLGTRVTDLVALDKPSLQPTVLLTILYGSPDRTLLPFFDPRTAAETPLSEGFRGVVAGQFDPPLVAPSSIIGITDLFALEETRSTATTTDVLAYLLEPTALGAMSVVGQPYTTTDFVVCPPGFSHPPGLCVEGSHFAAYRANPGASTDLAFAVDSDDAYDVMVFDPSAIGRAGGGINAHRVSLRDQNIVSEAGLSPHQLYVADIDGDGTNELVVGYEGDKTGAVVQCNAADNFLVCRALVIDGWSCGAVAPANVVAHQRFDEPPQRTSQDLVGVCRRADRLGAELVHIYFADSSFHAEEMFPVPASTQYIEVGDVTGDGVDDVLAYDKSSVPVLHVYTQCTSRDAASCPALDGETP